MRNLPLKLVTSLLVFVAGTGPAAADRDPKNYPGLACLPSESGTTGITRNVNNGRALNNTSSEKTFVCPAIKDGTQIVRALVFVLDRHPNQSVVCTLRSGRPPGPAQWFATKSTTGDHYGDEPVLLEFPGLQSVARGFYWLTCIVPRVPQGHGSNPSGVVMYQITEGP